MNDLEIVFVDTVKASCLFFLLWDILPECIMFSFFGGLKFMAVAFGDQTKDFKSIVRRLEEARKIVIVVSVLETSFQDMKNNKGLLLKHSRKWKRWC